MAKTYKLMQNVGACRYVINYCTGEKTHADGSPFFDIHITGNKRDANKFVRNLQKQGYTGNGIF